MGAAQRWDAKRSGPLCLDTVRALHQPPERFRVSLYSYSAGSSFGGTARAGRIYVLSGACSLSAGVSTWNLEAGDIADLPGGQYVFQVVGSSQAELVRVWELPAESWANTSKGEPGVTGHPRGMGGDW